MYSSAHRFIYLHVPKTGGNSIATALLPCSDDRLTRHGHQDGIERFGIEGVVTTNKHATLADYARAVDVATHDVFISVRHPFTRALSYYFSPHRWARAQADGSWRVEEPRWDPRDFLSCLDEMVPMVEFLRIADRVHVPSDVIRFEQFEEGFARVAHRLGIQVALPHRNRSAAPSRLFDELRADVALQARVERRFQADMEFFGYAGL